MGKSNVTRIVMTSQWMAVSEALDQLAKRFTDYVAYDWMAGYRAANEVLHNAMAGGELLSRPAPGNGYELKLLDNGGRVVRHISLSPDGSIPALFWHHYLSASDKARASRGRLIVPVGGARETESRRMGDGYRFREFGLVDDQILEGSVDSVEVLRANLPSGITANDAPESVNVGGRPSYDDSKHVDRVFAIMAIGNVPLRDAISRVANDLEPIGQMTSLKAKKARLRSKVKKAEKARKPPPGFSGAT